MGRKAAKELLHIEAWLERVGEITQRGKDVYLADALLKGAGDSLMMNWGRRPTGCPGSASWRPRESSGALAVANRNFIIHQYDEINRELTWLTLSRDLPAWRSSLQPLFAEASATIQDHSD